MFILILKKKLCNFIVGVPQRRERPKTRFVFVLQWNGTIGYTRTVSGLYVTTDSTAPKKLWFAPFSRVLLIFKRLRWHSKYLSRLYQCIACLVRESMQTKSITWNGSLKFNNKDGIRFIFLFILRVKIGFHTSFINDVINVIVWYTVVRTLCVFSIVVHKKINEHSLINIIIV